MTENLNYRHRPDRMGLMQKDKGGVTQQNRPQNEQNLSQQKQLEDEQNRGLARRGDDADRDARRR
jgi:hypothetical protein